MGVVDCNRHSHLDELLLKLVVVVVDCNANGPRHAIADYLVVTGLHGIEGIIGAHCIDTI